jgi:hypothetical protein
MQQSESDWRLQVFIVGVAERYRYLPVNVANTAPDDRHAFTSLQSRPIRHAMSLRWLDAGASSLHRLCGGVGWVLHRRRGKPCLAIPIWPGHLYSTKH